MRILFSTLCLLFVLTGCASTQDAIDAYKVELDIMSKKSKTQISRDEAVINKYIKTR